MPRWPEVLLKLKMKILLIFGHKNQGFILSKDSLARCRVAKEVYRQGDKIICLGGLFSPQQNGVAVSNAMKLWLTECGIPAEEITEENKSLTTIDNVVRVLPLLPLNSENKIFGITSEYHVCRTEIIWEIVTNRPIKMLPAEGKSSWHRYLVEAIGILVAILWSLNFRFPEMLFRKLARSHGKKNRPYDY